MDVASDPGRRGGRADGPEAIRQLPVDRIRTGFARLRPGRLRAPGAQLADAPLRVVPTDDDHYEVLDGFRRFERWSAAGRSSVPAIVERPLSAIDHKRLMLVANAPPRTVTAADEARIVQALIDEDGLTPHAVANLLTRKPRWVARRLQLATRLSPRAFEELAAGRLGPSAAYALTALATEDQDLVLETVLAHRLRATDIEVFVAAYRVADAVDRRAILADPRRVLAPDPSPILTPRAAELEGRLAHFRQVLADLRTFALPDDLAEPERRRLEALQRALYEDLVQTVRALASAWPVPTQPAPDETDHPESDTPHDRSEGGLYVDDKPTEAPAEGDPAPEEEEGGPARNEEGDRAPVPVLRIAPDSRARERVAQGGAARTGRGGMHEVARARSALAPGAVPRADPGACAQAADDHTHPARDPGTRVSRAANDPGRTRPRAPRAACDPGLAHEGEAPVRDRSGS
jgi:ParB-like chromosome segregation protein Spo0J